ncbi:MAG: prolyl oligopeptidase family serine peptidase [Actinomycetes bacterium]
MATPHTDSFPRQNARTLRFTLGRPRSFSVSPDGATVLFVRSASGTDRNGRLWRWTASDGEVQLVDPGALLAGADERLSAEERARRERAREAAGGIVSYSVDQLFNQVAFTLSGRLFVTDVAKATTRELQVARTGSPVIDPRIDPTGTHIAFVSNNRLWVVAVADGDLRAVSPEESSDTVSWGTADFVSAEELERSRGFWWSPNGDQLLAQRTDEEDVTTWFVSSPADPATPPVAQRYPAAGTPNPSVSLGILDLAGRLTSVDLPEPSEYIATVSWTRRGAPIAATIDRPQQTMTWVAIDPASGSTQLIRSVSNEQWVDVVPGSGAWDSAGRLLTVEVVDDDYALCADGARISPTGLDVRAVSDVGDDDILVAGSADAGSQQVWVLSEDHSDCVSPERGWHGAVRGGGTLVVVSADLEHRLPSVTVRAASETVELLSLADEPLIEPRVYLLPEAFGRPRVAVLFPHGHEPGSGTLPVLMDPYGGPHHASVAYHQAAFREAQWFADQGFAVVVVDGRGTPGSPSWERGVRGDFATPVLDDQVVGLHAAAHTYTDLDLNKVAIRGWSFGGYLSALAVIDRPEVFHAAVAGAPVTDWRLYDTGYTERYLGVPDDNDAASLESYERSSLLKRAASLTRPLQIIHGLADDNVFFANSLQLSRVLVENGRPHEVLPLSGITHMATQEEVAENLMLLQVDFLRRALDLS